MGFEDLTDKGYFNRLDDGRIVQLLSQCERPGGRVPGADYRENLWWLTRDILTGSELRLSDASLSDNWLTEMEVVAWVAS